LSVIFLSALQQFSFIFTLLNTPIYQKILQRKQSMCVYGETCKTFDVGLSISYTNFQYRLIYLITR